MKRVYLDHNATTPIRPEVRALFVDRLERLGGNPSSVHRSGREARAWLDDARAQTAAALGVHEDEILFTGGGTESISLALLGAVRAAGPAAGLATTTIEHSAVLAVANQLEREGRPVRRLAVDRSGFVDLEAIVEAARDPRIGVVSVQTANNEIGTILTSDQLFERWSELPRPRPLLHTDAIQALGRIPLRLREAPIDLAAFSAHKIGGPMGVGILFKRRGVALAPLVDGGGQEAGLRPGTENVPAICAAALALELAVAEQAQFARTTKALSRSFWDQLRAVVQRVELHGPAIDHPARLPNTLNLAFVEDGAARIDGRVLVTRLDLEGLEVSAGSACASGSLEPSHVMLALGYAHERARAAVRISIGRTTTPEDIHTAVDILRRTFLSLR